MCVCFFYSTENNTIYMTVCVLQKRNQIIKRGKSKVGVVEECLMCRDSNRTVGAG